MSKGQNYVTAISSAVVRVSSYIFLRWIPGPQWVAVILTAAIVHLTTFARTASTISPLEVVSEEVHVVTRSPINPTSKDAQNVKLLPGAARGQLQELDAEEVVVLKERDSGFFRSIVLGLPSPTSRLYNIITITVQGLLVFMTLDFVFRGPYLYPSHDLAFSRVGFVSHDSATILAREPDVAKLPFEVYYREHQKAESATALKQTRAWRKAGDVNFPVDLNADTDFTARVIIDGLSPDTSYEYSIANHLEGRFTTAPVPGTFPQAGSGKYTFLHSSCIKAQVPYNPLKHPLHIPGFEYLAQWIPKLKAQFMLFLGDFIYVDVPRRFGADVETYRSEYRRVYASPEWPSVSSNNSDPLPWIHVWDDHEIQNDWDRNSTGFYHSAADAYQHYHIAANPPPVNSAATYFSFTQGPASFFLMDTRSYRSPESSDRNDPTKTMLGRTQLGELLHWIRSPVEDGVKWKFIVSSIPFTKNWRFGDEDTWGTYLIERQLVLEAAWETSSEHKVGFVVLSGDRHEFAATKFPPPANSRWPPEVAVHEFSTSPLSMFYLPIKTYKQLDDEDICIKYIPNGNSKFAAVEISTPKHNVNSMLQYRLFVDGEEAWGYSLTSP